jgi:prolipoprotein diacylglyceryltransferase
MDLNVHFVFETLGYLAGGQTFWWMRRRFGDPLRPLDRFSVIGGAIFGAAVGSRLLAAFENPFYFTLSGKTILGGLLGGLIGVELMKKILGIRVRTGDAFALPLCVGISVGRLGCFFAGLTDGTHGSPTLLPWGHDYGDGIPRHPAQLYEIAFLTLLGALVTRISPGGRWLPGDRFKLFMAAYLTFRFFVEFLKPGIPVAGLTALQWAALAGLLFYARDVARWTLPSAAPETHG